MTLFVFRNRYVPPLVETFIAIRNMAGRATHSTKIATNLPSLDGVMTPLAFLPDVCVSSQRRIVIQSVQLVDSQGIRKRIVLVDKHVGLKLGQPFHVLTIFACPQSFAFVLRVFNGIVTVLMLVTRKRSKGPANALNLAGFRHHQAVPLNVDLLLVALSTGLRVNPRATWISKEILATVSDGLVGSFFRVAVVANNATGGVSLPSPKYHPS